MKFRILSIIVGITVPLILFGFVEGMCRLFFDWEDLFSENLKNLEGIYRYDSRIGRWHRRDVAMTYQWRKRDAAPQKPNILINNQGLRDTEHRYARIAGKYRIAVFGDSVTWGYGVSNGETFCDLLENKLPGTEVLNFGVIGYGTGEEWLLYRAEGRRYCPDIVMLVFYLGNDVQNNYRPSSVKQYPSYRFFLDPDESGRLRYKAVKLNLLSKWSLYYREYFYFHYALRKWRAAVSLHRESQKSHDLSKGRKQKKRKSTYEQLWEQLIPPHSERYGERNSLHYLEPPIHSAPLRMLKKTRRFLPASPENYYKVELTKKIISRFAEEVRADGGRFVVVFSPYIEELDPEFADYYNPLHTELLRFCAAKGYVVYDFRKAFLGLSKSRRKSLFFDRGHYTKAGNRIVCDLLAPLLEKLRLESYRSN